MRYGTPVEGERLSASVAAAGSGSGRVPLFAPTRASTLLSLPKLPKTPHRVNTSSTFHPQLRPKAPFCVNFPATRVLKTQRKQGIFSADCEKLRRRVRAGRVTRAVGE
jgi:hypothetical protein